MESLTDIKPLSSERLPMVSVLINCFNGEAYVKEAIESVYSQTYTNWEIVFWDNASVDNTEVIASAYDSKLRYFRSSELIPLHKARNLAIGKCKGTAVAFLDADDIWLSDKLERQMKLFSKQCPIIYGGYENIDQNGDKTGVVQDNCPSGRLTSSLLRKNSISIGSVLIDRELLMKFKFDERYHIMGDYDLWIRLSKHYEIVSVTGPVELSRQHDSNISDTQKDKWLSERRHFYKKFLSNNSVIRFPAIIWYIIKAELKGLFNAR